MYILRFCCSYLLKGDDEDVMAELRKMEDEMQDVARMLHPIDYLDAVGENDPPNY